MPQRIQFSFPRMTEEDLRRERLRSFWNSAAVAVVPYIAGVAWFISDELKISALYHGIPEIAMAGVIVAIASYCNTVFSFIKLEGWQRPGRWTVLHGSMVAILSVLAFVQYLKGAYAPSSSHNPGTLFFTSLVSFVGIMLFAWAMQHTFVSDECRYARKLRQELPR